MKKKDLFKTLSLTIATLLVFGACSSTTPPETTEETKATETTSNDVIKVGVANRTFKESAYLFMQQGSIDKASEYGDIEVDWQACDLNVAQQQGIIENFISQGYDVIAIEPTDSVSMVQQAKAVRDAGIGLIFIEQKMDGLAPDIFISGNNYLLGVMQVEDFVERHGTDEPVKAVLLYGTDGDFAAEEIKKGVNDTIAMYDNIEIVFEQSIQDWDREKAMKSMEDAISVNGDGIDVVFAANDGMALGAYKAAQNVSMHEDIMFYGGDNDEETNQMILDGAENIFVVDRGSYGHGEEITMVARELALGNTVEFDEETEDGYKSIWAPLTMVSYENQEPSKIKFPHLFE